MATSLVGLVAVTTITPVAGVAQAAVAAPAVGVAETITGQDEATLEDR